MQLIDQNLESFKSSKPVTLIDGIEMIFKDQISTYNSKYQAKFKELHKILLAQEMFLQNFDHDVDRTV